MASKSPKRPRGKLYTLGYEGRSLDEYLQILLDAGVRRLCDVRRNAFSHKKGFSKGPLGRACEAAGIAYQHLPELGIAAAERRAVKTPADRVALFKKYARATLPQQRAALDAIAARLGTGERLALTCFERDPQDCHRLRVVEALAVPCTHL
jgi:uncharacterized protein (DUF488 family)